MKLYVAVDTNVLVSALLSKKSDTATVLVIRSMLNGEFIPLYSEDILEEYDDVLHRTKKYRFSEENIRAVLNSIRQNGLQVYPTPTGKILPDEDDIIFYDVVMEKRNDDAFLVTGNLKHYPGRSYIVTPAEFMHILEENKKQAGIEE